MNTYSQCFIRCKIVHIVWPLTEFLHIRISVVFPLIIFHFRENLLLAKIVAFADKEKNELNLFQSSVAPNPYLI
jgi:hypothetical protein